MNIRLVFMEHVDQSLNCDEIWLPVRGYEGSYEISNRGRVKSLKRGRLLKPYPDMCGYLKVRLYKNNIEYNYFMVHRLVGLAFILNPEQKRTINHINSKKDNNNLDNLEWATHEENIQHAWKMGRYPKKHLSKNGKNTRDLHENEVLLVFEYRKIGKSQQKIADILQTSRGTVARILHGKTYLEYQYLNFI